MREKICNELQLLGRVGYRHKLQKLHKHVTVVDIIHYINFEFALLFLRILLCMLLGFFSMFLIFSTVYFAVRTWIIAKNFI